MRCIIVVPTYNESESVSTLLDALTHVVPGPDSGATRMDVLVVDDSSPDGTGAVVAAHPHFGTRIQLLTRSVKDGLGAAYRAGFAEALAADYDVVVQMDADGSHPTSEIPAMIAALVDHDVVIGSRYVEGGRTVHWPRRHRALSWGANVYARLLLGLRTRGSTSGFRAWRAAALVAAGAVQTSPSGYAFQVENTWRAERAGLSVTEHPITFTERTAGSSKMSIAVAGEAAARVLRWRFDELRGRPGAAPADVSASRLAPGGRR